jgi:MYXO-CTERM domain-containing protein
VKPLAFRVASAAWVVTVASACASNDGSLDPGAEPVGTAASAITAADAIARAEEWVTAKLLYCQSPNNASDTIDPACPPVCMRMSNPAWDPYRSDCSGLVSWAWGLPAPGRTTSEFAPNQNDITSVIQASTLQMGDAVNTDDSASSEHHIMLFKAWTIPGQEATFIEEPGCSANPNYAHEFTSGVTLSGSSIKVAYNGITFMAIHYAGLGSSSSSSSSSGAPPPPTCQVKGVDGVCIDTSVCATMPGYVSTPGYCPGPASEQCCTPTSSASTSSSSTSSSSSASSSGSAGTTGSSSSSASSTGGTTASSSGNSGTPQGSGGAPTTSGSAGQGASGPTGTVHANSGCASSPAAPAPAGGLAVLLGLALARRKKRLI